MSQRVRARIPPPIGSAGRMAARLVVESAESLADASILLGRRLQRLRRAVIRPLPASRRGRLAARARQPLPSLYDRHPEARSLAPRQLGLRTVPVDEVVGTAVAGPAQRGGDFLPLPPFRSGNWEARWQRIWRAVDRLTILPPVDLVKYAEGYWVEDGHNRVAAANYAGQVAIDASVTELVPPGSALTEAPSSLAADLVGSARLRAAGEGHRPAIDVDVRDS